MTRTEELQKIGEVAKKLGTTPRTLRFYEEEGLVISRRTTGGTRLYSHEDVARLRIILQLANLGISINNIKTLATARLEKATGAEASQAVSVLLEKMLHNVTQKKNLYEALERDIKQAMTIVQQCHRCQNLPTRRTCPTCPINDNLELSEMLRLIWDQDFDF